MNNITQTNCAANGNRWLIIDYPFKKMKKIAVSTWCTDDYAVHLRPDKLKKLVNYFHPEIDFHIVDTAQTEEIKKRILGCLLRLSDIQIG